MKKFNLFALCAIMLLCSFLFFGCDTEKSDIEAYKDQGFVAVSEITFRTSDSQRKTLNSICRYELINQKEITREEYLKNEYKEIFSIGIQSLDQDHSSYLKNQEKVQYRNENYYTAVINFIEIKYVYVKVLDDNKIEIIDTDGYHFLYSTTYLEIKYFKN